MLPQELYRERAKQCLDLADGSSDLDQRMALRDLALCGYGSESTLSDNQGRRSIG
jgi:hypothetical protein